MLKQAATWLVQNGRSVFVVPSYLRRVDLYGCEDDGWLVAVTTLVLVLLLVLRNLLFDHAALRVCGDTVREAHESIHLERARCDSLRLVCLRELTRFNFWRLWSLYRLAFELRKLFGRALLSCIIQHNRPSIAFLLAHLHARKEAILTFLRGIIVSPSRGHGSGHQLIVRHERCSHLQTSLCFRVVSSR